jgi:single-stranded DNA-binding protein
LKGKIGDRTQFWHVVAFSESAQAELMRLAEGDALSVQGALQAEPRNQNAAAEFSLGVVAEHVLPLRRPGKKLRDEGRSAACQEDVRWPPH